MAKCRKEVGDDNIKQFSTILLASFPGLLYLQFLITYSMQKWKEKAWESYHIIHGMVDGM